MHFSDFVRSRREKLSLSRSELADLLGDISEWTVKSWETGLNYPSPDSLSKLSFVLRVKFSFLRDLLVEDKYIPGNLPIGDSVVISNFLMELPGRSNCDESRDKILARLGDKSTELNSKLPRFNNATFDEIKNSYVSALEAYGKDIPYFYMMISKQILEKAVYLLINSSFETTFFANNLFLFLTDFDYFNKVIKNHDTFKGSESSYSDIAKDLINDYWSFNTMQHSTKTFEQTVFLRLWLSDLNNYCEELRLVLNKLSYYVNHHNDYRNYLFNDIYSQKLLLIES